MALYGIFSYGIVECSMVGYGMVWYSIVRCSMALYGIFSYGIVGCSMVGYGMVWFDVAQCDMVHHGFILPTLNSEHVQKNKKCGHWRAVEHLNLNVFLRRNTNI